MRDFEQNFDENDELIANTDPQPIVEDSDRESLEEEPTYQRPMTHSCTQMLMKANVVIRMHFGNEQCFKPEKETWISSLYQKVILFFKRLYQNKERECNT